MKIFGIVYLIAVMVFGFADSSFSAVRFSTLNAICKALYCQPSDILEFILFSAEYPHF